MPFRVLADGPCRLALLVALFAFGSYAVGGDSSRCLAAEGVGDQAAAADDGSAAEATEPTKPSTSQPGEDTANDASGGPEKPSAEAAASDAGDVAATAGEGADGANATSALDFKKQIEPIFRSRCYDCHGPETQEAGLRLDHRRAALDGGDSGPAIVPGKSGESLLYRYVAGLDEDVVMPPDDEPLSEQEVALLKWWIDLGAEWPGDPNQPDGPDVVQSDHWAFQPIRRPALPEVAGRAWVRNPIDRFVLAKLESLGIAPSPEAARATLLRRLYLDLIGLPPSAEEVVAFELDSRPDAYERRVDELLASQHYGERWARHWLDAARYSDSDGYEKDLPRPYAWRWRDWVIDALNRDMPFDQFTIEQLAGDLLPGATIDQKIATGFHRNTLTNREGGIDPEEDRVKQAVDRTSTTATVWLGLTLRCCQCHSHKYDPFTQREFYRFYAFFNNADELDISAPLPEELAAYEKAKAEFDQQHQRLEQAVAEFRANELPQRFEAWEAETQEPLIVWQVLRPVATQAESGASLEPQEDGSLLATGPAPQTDRYTIEWVSDLPEITALRLEALPDERLPGKGPGRAQNGNFVINELQLFVATGPEASDWQPVAWGEATADFSQHKFAVPGAVDGDAKTGWAVVPRTGKPHAAVLALENPISTAGARRLKLVVEQRHGGQHTLGRFRVLATTAPGRVAYVDDETAAALATPPGERSQAQRDTLRLYYETVDEQLAALREAVAQHEQKRPKYPPTKAQTLTEHSEPRTTHVHIRGDFLRPGPVVQPGTPAVLPPLPDEDGRPDRLDLARWIASAENPLTARVIVNRVWQGYFGRGLVATEDDFGTQGDEPSHPELLDWLASEFIEQGWSLKKLHRLIVTSATYRQQSTSRPALAELDPENRLLARQNRLRVEGEIVRDLALAVSGLLYPKVGGPSIRPPLPEGVAELGYAGSVKWQESAPPEKYRRGLYIFNQRTVPYPMLTSFDAPDSSVVCTRRERSNTPLQSLTILNDPVFYECAQRLGQRLAELDKTQPRSETLEYAFRSCLARRPTVREQRRLETLFEELLALYAEQPELARQAAGAEADQPGETGPEANATAEVGSTAATEAATAEVATGAANETAAQGPVDAAADAAAASAQTDAQGDVARRAAWVALGRTLINLDEFITRE